MDMIKATLKSFKREFMNMGCINLMVIGNSRSGKKDLIDKMFGSDFVEQGSVQSVTNSVQRIEKSCFPLNLYDVDTLESSAVSYIDEICGVIEYGIKSDNIFNKIHCVWFCVNGNRENLNEQEINILNAIIKLKVPMKIVITQAYSRSVKNLKNYIKKLNRKFDNVICLLTEDIYVNDVCIKKAYGTTSLVNETIRVIPKKTKRAFVSVQNVSLEIKKNVVHSVIFKTVAAGFTEGFIPLPFADAALLIPTQLNMIATITAVYGVDISESGVIALLSSLLGTTGATVCGKTIVASLLKFIPFAGGAVGGIISGSTAAALTMGLGKSYCAIIERMHFEQS